MTFGGFLGIGDEYRALPWSGLRYSPDLDAYELNATEDRLRYAPMLAAGWETGVIDRDWEHRSAITAEHHLIGDSYVARMESVKRRYRRFAVCVMAIMFH